MELKKITDDFYHVIYKVDLANKTCSCDDFHFRNKKKKNYKCKHLIHCIGLKEVKE